MVKVFAISIPKVILWCALFVVLLMLSGLLIAHAEQPATDLVQGTHMPRDLTIQIALPSEKLSIRDLSRHLAAQLGQPVHLEATTGKGDVNRQVDFSAMSNPASIQTWCKRFDVLGLKLDLSADSYAVLRSDESNKEIADLLDRQIPRFEYKGGVDGYLEAVLNAAAKDYTGSLMASRRMRHAMPQVKIAWDEPRHLRDAIYAETTAKGVHTMVLLSPDAKDTIYISSNGEAKRIPTPRFAVYIERIDRATDDPRAEKGTSTGDFQSDAR